MCFAHKNLCLNHIAGGVVLWILLPTESNVRGDVFFNKHEEIFFGRVERTKGGKSQLLCRKC